MGGINHAPCSKYLRNSTRVSRFMSLARAELELGNVSLEDALLADLGRKPAEKALWDMEGHLILSSGYINSQKEAIRDLRQQMRQENYTDLPTLRTINLEQLGAKLCRAGMVDDEAWQTVTRLMYSRSVSSGGFYEVLNLFDETLEDLRRLTLELIDKIEHLRAASRAMELSSILEENKPGNIKVVFAQLYQGWADFQQIFLASSMLSTELWYQYSGVDTLLQEERVSQQFSVA